MILLYILWEHPGNHQNETWFPALWILSSTSELTILPLPLTREQLFGFNAPDHCLVRVRMLHCMRVRLCNGYMRAYVQIMQHMHTHKAMTGLVEAKKLLSRSSKAIKLQPSRWLHLSQYTDENLTANCNSNNGWSTFLMIDKISIEVTTTRYLGYHN